MMLHPKPPYKSRPYTFKKKPKPHTTLSFFHQKMLAGKDITLFTRQLTTLISAGIPMAQSLSMLLHNSSKPTLKKLIQNIKKNIEQGNALSVSLRKFPHIFDELYCGLIEAGEAGGTVDIMLERLALYREKTENLKKAIKKALYYPATVMLVTMSVILILSIKVIPGFKEMFKGYNAPLPAFTSMIFALSDILKLYGGYVLILLTFLGTLLGYFYCKSVTIKHLWQKICLGIPIFGSLFKKIILVRFAHTLATTMTAGIPLTEALKSIAKASNNIVYFAAIEHLREGLCMGQSLHTLMQKNKIFPETMVQMVGIGESSGKLENMLAKIATIYEEELNLAVNGLTILLEPFMMVVLGVIVGGIVVAMYLPLFKIGAII